VAPDVIDDSDKHPGGRSTIAFLGLFGVGNLGNEASLAAGLEAAERCAPTAPRLCICGDPVAVERDHGVPAVAMWSSGRGWTDRIHLRVIRLLMLPVREAFRWRESIRVARRCSIIVVPGTGILDDFGVRPQGVPYHLLRWALAARISRTPVALVGIGAGPIEHPVTRRLMRWTAALAGRRSYRDQVSKEFMRTIGIDVDADPVIPDVVFGLHESTPVSRSPSDAHQRTRVGVGLMAYHGWSNDPHRGSEIHTAYLERLCRLVGQLIAEGHQVRTLIGEATDQSVVDELHHRLGLLGAEVISEPIPSFEQLLHQIAQTDVVIATRYHNVVAALLRERPVVSIGYATKNVDLLRAVGLEQYCQHVESFDAGRAVEDARTLAASCDAYAGQIRAVVARHRAEVHEEFRTVFDSRRTRSRRPPIRRKATP
jgi:polysaccharide pyruvyl transferase WcaK-like protein